MKLSILFLLFSSLFLLNSSLSLKFLEELTSGDEKLLSYICKVVDEVTGTRNDTQDILIGHIGGSRLSQVVNDVTQCIGGDKIVVITNFYTLVKEKKLRKASVIVLVAYQPDRVS